MTTTSKILKTGLLGLFLLNLQTAQATTSCTPELFESQVDETPTCIAGNLKTITQGCPIPGLLDIFQVCPQDTLHHIANEYGQTVNCTTFQTHRYIRMKRNLYLSKVRVACRFLIHTNAASSSTLTPLPSAAPPPTNSSPTNNSSSALTPVVISY